MTKAELIMVLEKLPDNLEVLGLTTNQDGEPVYYTIDTVRIQSFDVEVLGIYKEYLEDGTYWNRNIIQKEQAILLE